MNKLRVSKSFMSLVIALTCFTIVILLSLLTWGCGSESGITGINVTWQGYPYGDFLIIQQMVKDCMGTDKEGSPYIRLVDNHFDCYGVDAVGCFDGSVTMWEAKLLSSKGNLWAHELTHFYGESSQGNHCGNVIMLEGFHL